MTPRARLLLVMLLCLAGCGETPPQGASTRQSPPASTAVGPTPGPGDDTIGTVNPYSDNRTALGEGRQLFVRFNCSGCHGGRGGGGMAPSLRDIGWLYGSRDDQVFSSIAEGRAHGMPSWQTTLTADQSWKLVAYIKSMRTGNEPQAPPSD